ncbi:MAG: Peptidase, M23 family [candidate division WS6 bacterium GW2011_GWF2_39_15]|uniref:Peptidase, M23 family n=1 Tax=candidate division WS6 bacterium GW2011_GWF2_39_15 TaxID=1619100 RepID=A0A0G0MTF4_9BACT|nr:MAG: Peptidase, M23 family [candidate division WS6 bacterium GW2011_GWF2_39_15]
MCVSKTIKTVLSLVIILIYSLTVYSFPIYSEDIDDLEQEVQEKSQTVKEKESALDKIKKEIAEINRSSVSVDEKISLMKDALDEIDLYIKSAQLEIKLKSDVISQKEGELSKEQEKLDLVAAQLYKSSRFSFWEYILANKSVEDIIKGVFLRKLSGFDYVDKLKLLSQNYAQMKQEKMELEKDKVDLESEKNGLEKSKNDLVAQRNALLAEASKKRGLSTRLGTDITALKGEISQLQEAILLAKAAGGILGVGDVPGAADNLSSKSGFMANAASGNFAVFAFGAYTHRNGMSQYGAYGRAKAGQNAEQILKAYYPAETLNKNYGVPSKIYVNGTNEYGQTFNCQAFSIDDYVKHLYEVPASWPTEVLRAQSVAARSYAIRYSSTHKECGGPTICPSQSCQVVKKEVNATAWRNAVDYTSKWVLAGGPGNFQFSSTTGGYLNTSGWDTTNKQGTGNWTPNAYEGVNYGNSPWFYKTWSTLLNGSVCNSSKKDVTGNNRNYLSNKEMADILNVWLINNNDPLKGSVDYSRIIPVTINDCHISGMSGNPYSKEALASLLKSPVTVVSSIAASFNSKGQTTNILFGTNRGVLTVSASDFKAMYNLRAPGYLQIPPQGSGVTFINIEKK